MRADIDPDIFTEIASEDIRSVALGATVQAATAPQDGPLVLGCGVAAESCRLADGRRQILALRFPGDALTPRPGESIVALTPVRLSQGSRLRARLADAAPRFQPLRRAWLTAEQTDQAMLRDHVVRLGRLSAFERTAHMLLESHERLAQVGLVRDTTFHLPLTQEVVSDVIGLSVVHLNRTLQALRREGLVSLKQGYVTLADRRRLVDITGYVSRFPRPWRPSATPDPRRAVPRDTIVRPHASAVA